jgi:hypothetical protein
MKKSNAVYTYKCYRSWKFPPWLPLKFATNEPGAECDPVSWVVEGSVDGVPLKNGEVGK